MLLVIEVHGVQQVFYYYRSKQGKALAFDIDQSLKQLTNSRNQLVDVVLEF